jgi:hypothetical protein
MGRGIRWTTLTAAMLTGLAPRAASAQWGVWQADSLLASGQVAAAESLYYAASSARPRDAMARAALGRYLAARGALRIGAVLLEEARLFGGDSAGIARALSPIYRALGDYRALAVLPKSSLSDAERNRVSWMVSHPQVLEFADSVATVTYRPVGDGSGLGTVSVRIGERRVDALIDPRTSGVVLRGSDARRRRDLRVFGQDTSGIVAVIPELRIGGVMLGNVPARLDTAATATSDGARRDDTSLIGLDVLRRLAPTFDPTSSTLLLRRSGQVSPTAPGVRVPILLDETGLRVLIDGRWDTVTSHRSALLLATKRWTLDARRGEAVIQ